MLHLLDTATAKEKPAPKLPIGLVGGLEWHDNGRDLGLRPLLGPLARRTSTRST